MVNPFETLMRACDDRCGLKLVIMQFARGRTGGGRVLDDGDGKTLSPRTG